MGKQITIKSEQSSKTFEQKCLVDAHNQVIAQGGNLKITKRSRNKGFDDTPLFKKKTQDELF